MGKNYNFYYKNHNFRKFNQNFNWKNRTNTKIGFFIRRVNWTKGTRQKLKLLLFDKFTFKV